MLLELYVLMGEIYRMGEEAGSSATRQLKTERTALRRDSRKEQEILGYGKVRASRLARHTQAISAYR